MSPIESPFRNLISIFCSKHIFNITCSSYWRPILHHCLGTHFKAEDTARYTIIPHFPLEDPHRGSGRPIHHTR
ncbi:hypothetical protein BgiBS90_005181, partial [Biomphalaria glabrata]